MTAAILVTGAPGTVGHHSCIDCWLPGHTFAWLPSPDGGGGAGRVIGPAIDR